MRGKSMKVKRGSRVKSENLPDKVRCLAAYSGPIPQHLDRVLCSMSRVAIPEVFLLKGATGRISIEDKGLQIFMRRYCAYMVTSELMMMKL